MKKSMIFPIHKKWVDMIFDGSKDLEFRNKLPKHLKPGMKIYFYETKSKERHRSVHCYVIGLGMIVGEATVGDMWYINNSKALKTIGGIRTNVKTCTGRTFDYNEFKKLGYTNQQYAIELTNVIRYDEEWLNDKMNKLVDMNGMPGRLSNKWNEYKSAPTSPIPKDEFVSWNKKTIIDFNIQCPIYVFEK